jgi:large subunit ribosomal protein L37Ae
MYSHTRKVSSLGRYGPRIGRKLRENLKTIEDTRRKKSQCGLCSKNRIKKRAPGIWYCPSCKTEFTGGAHIHKLE